MHIRQKIFAQNLRTLLEQTSEDSAKRFLIQFAGTGHSASTTTSGHFSSTAGARIKIPRNVSGPPSFVARFGIGRSASKFWIWENEVFNL